MSANTNIIDDFEPLVAMATSAPMLFLCGSGISIPFPAALPSAWDMINWTSSILKPEAATQEEEGALKSEQEAIYEAPPEVFYQGLFDLVGPVAVQPWTALSLHDRTPQAFPRSPGPTLGHLVVTYLSWRSHVPIVTTNFDTYFEAAARKLDIRPIVSLPFANAQWKEARPEGTQVAIWKIHGSAESPGSICTTLERISMSNWTLLERLKTLIAEHRTCLLGYSGRDIDCFPFIASFPSKDEERLFWVDSKFSSAEHRIYARPERFVGIKGTIDQFAEALLARLDLNSRVEERLRVAAQECISTLLYPAEDAKEDIKHVYQRETERIVTKEILPKLKLQDMDLRPLLHGSSLASIHKFGSAVKYCERFLKSRSADPDPRWTVKAWIILASCYHNLSKYKESEKAARQALKIAMANNLISEAIYALSATDEGMRMQLDLDVCVDARPIIGKVKTLGVFAKSFLDIFRLEKWALKADISSARVKAEILEHRIRLYAIPQGILIRLGARRFADWLLSGRWKRIREKAYDVGYAAGIGNALKFLLRASPLDEDLPGKLSGASADQVFDLIKHKPGSALILRDHGVALVRQHNTAEAALCFEKAQRLAHEEGNSSLELKALLGLCECGRKVDLQQIRALAESVENDAQDKVVRAVLRRAHTLATKGTES